VRAHSSYERHLNFPNGSNSRIKMVKVRSRGFGNKDRFKSAIYFHLGGLDLYPETAAG